MRDARENGFEVTMFYVGLGDYRLNIERVAVRVQNGGHHIASEDIIRRDKTSIQNLLSHLDLINYLIVIDNSDSSGEIMLEVERNTIKYRVDSIPAWVEVIENHLQK